MTQELKEQLKKRFYSALWRAGAMFVSIMIAGILDSADALSLSPFAIMILGIVLGEVTKFLNNQTKEDRAVI